jgi:methionyl-tRNA synthetase
VLDLLDGGRLRVLPETRRREARAFVAAGLEDISVSRSQERARGWGIPVPGDPGQAIWVWFDALANYVTALGYPGADERYRTFWEGARRIHVIGKDILRFHAVYWPAFLLSAGLPPPDTILVHGFLHAGGARLSKSDGVAADPAGVAARAGADALRHWILRAVGQGEDADWAEERVRDLRIAELGNELGNLVQRTVSMVRSYRAGVVPAGPAPADCPLPVLAGDLGPRLRAAVADGLDPQAGLLAVWALVRATNRYASETGPWHLAREPGQPGLDGVLLALAESLRVVAEGLRPFLPATAVAVAGQVGVELGVNWHDALRWRELAAGARVAEPRPLFPRRLGPTAG